MGRVGRYREIAHFEAIVAEEAESSVKGRYRRYVEFTNRLARGPRRDRRLA
jgi:hypothetical protein